MLQQVLNTGSAFTAVYVAAALALPAQQRVDVLHDPACAPCAASLEEVVTFGDLGGPGVIESYGWLQVRRNSQGYYYLADETSIKVYASDGSYFRTIGREGSGPGEYRSIQSLQISDGDTIRVFDGRNRRYSVVSADGEFVRSLHLPGGLKRATVLGDGTIVIAQQVRTPTRVGHPLHLVGTRGNVIRSFGARDPVLRPELQTSMERRVIPSADGTFWAAHVSQYRIERWDTSGTLLGSMARSVDWFSADQDMRWFTERGVPSMLRAIEEDADGNVRVLVSIGDDNWRDAVRTTRTADGRNTMIVDDHTKFYDTVLEVIDPNRATVLMSRRFDQSAQGFVENDAVFGYWMDTLGNPRITVWRIHAAQ